MTTFFTMGTWIAKPGERDEFLSAWNEFAQWASSMPGAGELRLACDLGDDHRFVSFGDWNAIEPVHEWKGSDEFRPRMGKVQAHVANFTPLELEQVAGWSGGSSTAI
jgi:heme-degrading monooxygenase HmoA